VSVTNYIDGKPWVDHVSGQPVIGWIPFNDTRSPDIYIDNNGCRYVAHRDSHDFITSMDVFDPGTNFTTYTVDFLYYPSGKMSEATYHYLSSGWKFEKVEDAFDEGGKTMWTKEYKNGKLWVDHVSGQPIIGDLGWGIQTGSDDIAVRGYNRFIAHRTNEFISSMDDFDQNNALSQTWDFSYSKSGKMITAIDYFKGFGWHFDKTVYTFDENGKSLTTINYKDGKPVNQ
jgi:hypothetical protein